MEDRFDDKPESNSEKPVQNKNKIGLPLIALSLGLFPVLLFLLLSALRGGRGGLTSLIMLVMVSSPVAGMMMGISALRIGKASIGTAGMIIAGIAVVLPLILLAVPVVFLIGVTTGLITLM